VRQSSATETAQLFSSNEICMELWKNRFDETSIL